ncbi:MAG: TraR/DksA family transcriptional regulator [Bdellovibrio sp.]|nr:TraR/DksA family transcriptional regulator [Bdellovibrio sp.]
MTSADLFQLRSVILTSIERINESSVIARKDFLNTSEAQPGIHVDENDHARDEATLNTQLELHSRNLCLRNQLYAALARIANGSYGLCLRCEETIDLRRLQARPAALLCLHCQTRQENKVTATLHPSVGRRSPEVLNLSLLTA